MSLRHALLGLLADTPQTGYDLSKLFERSLSRYAWHASHSHIYPELKKMAADGLVEVVEEGARGKRTYAVTEQGTAELRRWMFEPMRDRNVRDEFILRLFTLSVLEPEDIRLQVERLVSGAAAAAAELAEAIERIEETSGPVVRPGFARFAAEFGMRWQQMQRDWGLWIIEQLDHHEK